MSRARARVLAVLTAGMLGLGAYVAAYSGNFGSESHRHGSDFNSRISALQNPGIGQAR
jgi:hypothetical protein